MKSHGADRARYGSSLVPELAKHLDRLKIANCNRRQLYDYLRFYRAYPGILPTASAQSPSYGQVKSTTIQKVPTLSAQSGACLDRIRSLSYSMFKLLVDLDDDFKRAFYERECLSGGWSVRELKRQIASLYFERSHLSRSKKTGRTGTPRRREGRASPRYPRSLRL